MGGVHTRRSGLLSALICLWICGAAAAATNQPDEKIVKVGVLSFASTARVTTEARELGINAPLGLVEQNPFFSADAIDPDRPIGVFIFAGPTLGPTMDRRIAMAVPMKEGVATLKSFIDRGAKPLGGGSGAVELNGAYLRRTPTYLIVSRTREAVLDVREAELVDPYRPPQTARDKSPNGMLFRYSADLAAMRQVEPERVQWLVDNLNKIANDTTLPVARDIAAALASKADRLELMLVRHDQELSLKIGVAPLRIPAGGTFPRPGMPDEAIARIDVGAPPLQVLPWAEAVFGRYVPGVQHDDFVHNLADILLGGQAVSVGIEPRGGFAIVYMVQQQVKADPIARLKQLAEQSDLAANYATDKTKANRMDFGQYTSEHGLHVTRVKFMQGNTCTLCLDVVRQADTVYLTGSTDLSRYIESLVGQKQQGQFSGLINGSVSLGALLEIVSDAIPKNVNPPPQLKPLREILKGRTLTLSATGGRDEAVFGITVDRGLVKDLVAAFRSPSSQ
jgi:hypothetical protein